MTSVKSAKLMMAFFWIPLMIVFSPVIALVGGVMYFWEVLSTAVTEEIRWAKYVDDYNAKSQVKR